MLNKATFLVLAMLLSGCASSYKPSTSMLSLKQGMDKQQATAVFAEYAKPSAVNAGFCGGGHSMDAGTPAIVSHEGYSYQAYVLGERIKSEKVALSTIITYKKDYFQAVRKFSNISKIRVMQGPVVYGSCNDKNPTTYAISIYFGTSDNDAFAVGASGLDEMMAALVTLAPQAKLMEGAGF